MKKVSKRSSPIWLLVIVGIVVLLATGICGVEQAKISAEKSSCESSGKVYETDSRTCREKTTSEKFAEKCTDQVTISGSTYSCSQLKNSGLEEAYLASNIIAHDGVLYEGGTSAEIAAGKQAGDYCLSASDAWNHIGETRCVVFDYTYMSCSSGYCFLDEKKNYNLGFVAFFGKYNMYTWANFVATYKDKGPILVCGKIYSYNGHPEIKITNVSRQTVLGPTATYRGGVAVYQYSCT